MENWLYPAKPFVPRQRTKPMQVLALGLSRSGTDSLRAALITLGFDHVYHGADVGSDGDSGIRKAWSDLGEAKWAQGRNLTREDFEGLLGHCEAVTDQPCACFALELIEAYPEAKVILNLRDTQSWYTSLSNTFVPLLESWSFRILFLFEPSLYWLRRCFLLYDHHFFQSSLKRHAKRVQREHYAMIRGSVPAERLLEWRVQDGWDPLCLFLGKAVPADEEFPNGNTPEELLRRISQGYAAARRRAQVNMAFAGSGLVTVLGVVAYQSWRLLK